MLEMEWGCSNIKRCHMGPCRNISVKDVQEQDEVETPIESHLAKDEMIFVYKRIHVVKEMSSFS
jgi:hypothetical protein